MLLKLLQAILLNVEKTAYDAVFRLNHSRSFFAHSFTLFAFQAALVTPFLAPGVPYDEALLEVIVANGAHGMASPNLGRSALNAAEFGSKSGRSWSLCKVRSPCLILFPMVAQKLAHK